MVTLRRLKRIISSFSIQIIEMFEIIVGLVGSLIKFTDPFDFFMLGFVKKGISFTFRTEGD